MRLAASTCCLVLVLIAGVARAADVPAPVLDAEAQRVAVMNKAKESVLAVFAPNGQGGGSGVVVSADGYALTNFHVVQPCGAAMQCGMADGRVYDAVVVGIDPTGDVALIKLFGRDDFPRARWGDSDGVRTGDSVFAMGNPFLLATDLQPTATWGIVSGVHRYQPGADTLLEYTDCLQIDASVNPGNSGGPLFDARGRLIGINGRCSFEKRGRVNVGVAYAISINQIKNFLGDLHSGRLLDHATLGATVAAGEDGRVAVTDILESSDAYRRGLRYDDEIVSFGGRTISTANGFKNILGVFPKGWRVPLSYRRDGKRYDIWVRLAGLHGEQELIDKLTRADVKPPAEPKSKPKSTPKKKPEKTPQAKIKPPAEIPLPEVVKKHFEEKRGFVNYFFNRQNQRRVWKAWNAAGMGGVWTFSGPLPGGNAYEFQIDDAGASLKLPSTRIDWKAGDEFSAALLPPHSGGLLPALYLWRRLAVEGLGRFGQVRYEGMAPLPGRAPLADVLVGTHKGVECRFYFDPADGQLLALEFFADESSDPCEVYFLDYRSLGGHPWPTRIVVRYGDETFAAFKVEAAGTREEARHAD